MTTKEAAKALGVSTGRVRQLIKTGRLPATKPGRDLVIQEKDLELVRIRKPGKPKKGETP